MCSSIGFLSFEFIFFKHLFFKRFLFIGVDPLASSKGFWADLMGFGDFYNELAVKIIQISVQTRAENGGIISVKELAHRINSSTPNNSTSSRNLVDKEDIQRAVSQVQTSLDPSFCISSLNNSLPCLISTPSQLSNDHLTLLSISSSSPDRSFNHPLLLHQENWSQERFVVVVKPLLRGGGLWVDDPSLVLEEGGDVSHPSLHFYFISLWRDAYIPDQESEEEERK